MGPSSRRALIGFAAILLLVVEAAAAPLHDVPLNLPQPDGTAVELLVTGDEFHRTFHDGHGYLVLRDPATGWLVYGKKVDGKIVATTLVAGRSDPVAAGLAPDARPDPKRIPDLRHAQAAAATVAPAGTPGVPAFSSMNGVVVFVRFAGESEFTDPVSAFDAMFNATSAGANSMRAYFSEASYGKFNVTSAFFPSSSGTVVSYQDSSPRGYYDPYDSTLNASGYQSDNERLQREHTLFSDAIAAIAAAVPGSLDLDTNGDGYADGVVFVLSGALSTSTSTMPLILWPHTGSLTTGFPATATIGAKAVDRYNVQVRDALMSAGGGVGLLCHELAHILGAPDLSHASGDGFQPVATWDLMGTPTNPPQHMSAYVKWKYLGWLPSIPAITGPGTYTLNPLASPSGNCYRILSPLSLTQYFVVEFRKKSGTFESSLPGSGLLVYRVNTSVSGGSGNRNGPPDELYLYRLGGSQASDGAPAQAYLAADATPPRTAINDIVYPPPNTPTDPLPPASSLLADGSPGGLSIHDVGPAAGSTISFTTDLLARVRVLADDFEGAFPAGWRVSTYAGYSTVGWGRSTYRADGGTGSAWCAGSQPAGIHQYVANMWAKMINGPFSLADATSATLEFDLWSDATLAQDFTHWAFSADGLVFYENTASGKFGWVHQVLNYADVIPGPLPAQAWIGFFFSSTTTPQGEGAYVDNVVVSKMAPGRGCTYGLSPATQAFPAAGGTGAATVTAASGCAWAAATDASWVNITGPATADGTGSVAYSVAQNFGAARSAALSIAGQTVTVTQDASVCTYGLAPAQQSFTDMGGTGTVTVTAGAACTWTASANVAWVTINSGSSGTSDGTVGYTVLRNFGSGRSGTITIAGQTVTVTQAATSCVYSISPTQASFGAAGGNGTVGVTTAAGCEWAAVSGVDWITVTSGATGSGSGTVGYSAAINLGTPRSGSITIAGQPFTVNQDTGTCTYSISPAQQSFPATGGTGTISVTAAAGCPWTAASNADWASITGGGNGTGAGAVAFAVASNAGDARAGTLTIADQTFSITQDGVVGCTYSVTPTRASLPAAGGSGSFTVATGAGCTWTAVADQPWIYLTSGASGSGPGAVAFTADANPAPSRSGTITVGGAIFAVDQAGSACAYVLNASAASFAVGGGSGSFKVTTGGACSWTASTAAGWIHLVGGTGSGSAWLYYNVDANLGAARSAAIAVQDQTLTVSQEGSGAPAPFAGWLGAVSHTDGVGGSHWRSDVAVLNRSGSAASVEYRLYTADGVKSQQASVADGAQDFHRDIAQWLGYTTGSGALQVVSDQGVTVMGRTYNQVDAAHTYGQNYDGQGADSGLLSAGQSAWLPLLAQNPSYRCNIAVTNTGADAASVTLTLYDGAGNQLWSGSDESTGISPGGFIQYLQPFSKYGGRNDIEQGYAKVTVTSGSGVMVWASVIDANTGDPTTVFMKR